jgi:hypothetical protein
MLGDPWCRIAIQRNGKRRTSSSASPLMKDRVTSAILVHGVDRLHACARSVRSRRQPDGHDHRREWCATLVVAD